MSTNINRKDFLKGLASTSVAFVAGSSAILAACGEGPKKDPCIDTSSLSESDKSMRKTLGYIEKSADASKNCSNCQLKKAADKPGGCLGCQLFSGPVTQKGYCNSWVAAQG